MKENIKKIIINLIGLALAVSAVVYGYEPSRNILFFIYLIAVLIMSLGLIVVIVKPESFKKESFEKTIIHLYTKILIWFHIGLFIWFGEWGFLFSYLVMMLGLIFIVKVAEEINKDDSEGEE